MHLINRIFQISAIALTALPVSAYADSWSCSHDNLVREVHTERSTSAPVPCNVVYRKLTEGVEDQVLWNATSDENFCEEKAKAFVAKLESWGWVCAETIRDRGGDTSSVIKEDNMSDEGDTPSDSDAE